jgi:type III secretion system FlhB-like substrate exporter
MKIGALHITWRTSQKIRDDRLAVLTYLATTESARAIIAKMARAEVKNYLAELAEQAEVPFGDPAEFVRDLAKPKGDGWGGTL